MKLTWKEVQERVENDDKHKEDVYTPLSRIMMNSKSGLINLGASGKDYGVNEFAFGQFCARLGIPANYGRKCYELGQENNLFALQFNTWMRELERKDNKTMLCRTKGNGIRAFLTDKYSILDNSFVINTLDECLMSQNAENAVNIRDAYISDKSFHLRMTFPDLTQNFGTKRNPDLVTGGVHIVNSEVGYSMLTIESIIYRLVCSNGLIVAVGGERILAQRHLYLKQDEIQARFIESLNEAIVQANSSLKFLAKSREIKVENPIDLIKKLAEENKYSQDFSDAILNSWNTNPGDTAYEIINAFTESAKLLPFEKRVDVEKFAGDLMLELVA